MRIFLGQNIKKIRKHWGMTLQEFSEIYGSTKTGLWRIEKNEWKPNVFFLAKLNEHCGIDVNDLIYTDLEKMVIAAIPNYPNLPHLNQNEKVVNKVVTKKLTISNVNFVGKWAEFWFEEEKEPEGEFFHCSKSYVLWEKVEEAELGKEIMNHGFVGKVTEWIYNEPNWDLVSISLNEKITKIDGRFKIDSYIFYQADPSYLRNLSSKNTPEEAFQLIISMFTKVWDAKNCIVLIKSQVPMYTGNLNPLWKFWDDVEKCFGKELTKEELHKVCENYRNQ